MGYLQSSLPSLLNAIRRTSCDSVGTDEISLQIKIFSKNRRFAIPVAKTMLEPRKKPPYFWGHCLEDSQHNTPRVLGFSKTTRRQENLGAPLVYNRKVRQDLSDFSVNHMGAQERTRTSNPLRGLPPQGSASTNFATWACL